MFYIKVPLSDGASISADITDNNVFTHCAYCGREIPVDLEEIAGDCKGPVLGTSVFCSKDCCCAFHKENDQEYVCEDDTDLDPFAGMTDD